MSRTSHRHFHGFLVSNSVSAIVGLLMQNETRVNLKHLLEDMRDSYNSPLEEVILTELIANALDSKATRLDFIVDPTQRFLRCIDNGGGMKRAQLKDYHNIASSDKVRGAGIGFAGVGAKLSLLLADKVVTESKGGRGLTRRDRMATPIRTALHGSLFDDRSRAIFARHFRNDALH